MHVSTYGQLSASAHDLGGSLRFERPFAGDTPILIGTQSVLTLGNGLILYLSQSRDLVDARSQNLLQPGITAAFLLQGQAEVSLGRQQMLFDAGRASQRAMLINLTDSDQFQRQWQAGRQETKLCLHFSPAWFEQFDTDESFGSPRMQQFRRSHGQSLPWQPSVEITQRALRLATHDATTPAQIRRMRYEGFALDLAADILQGIDAPPHRARLGARQESCVRRLKDWLDSGTANHLSIGEMARELGTNAVDLQNGFRAMHGTTIATYLRRQRLDQACQALRAGTISVETAAAMAGYEHVSSFSNAFKREYGVPPSQVRN